MNAMTLGSREIEVPPDALDAWRSHLRSPVIVPGDPAYDEARTL